MLIRLITTGYMSFAFALLASNAVSQTHNQAPIELSGFSVSEAFNIPDGQPLDISAKNFRRMLYRVLQTSNTNLKKYARYSEQVDWSQLTGNTPDYRMWVFDRRGRITFVKRIALAGVDRETPIKFVFQADCVSESGQPFRVISLARPTAWRQAKALDQPIQFLGFLYAMVDPNDSESATSIPLFIAPRIAWYPTDPDVDLGVTPSQALLANNGVDIGGLDWVRQEQNKKLEWVDRDIFFQFLSAVNKIPFEPPVPTLDFTELLQHPQENFGNAVAFRARVRKCTPVHLSDTQSDSSLDFDQYYQLMVFPDLESQVEVPSSDPEKSPLVYRRFPVTLCCRSLPPGMTAAEIENQQIWVSGFYFRFWRYRSDLTDAAGELGQLSPLIIARQPILIESDEAKLNLLTGGLLVGLFFGLVSLAWIYRNMRRTKKSLPASLPDQIDLKGLE